MSSVVGSSVVGPSVVGSSVVRFSVVVASSSSGTQTLSDSSERMNPDQHSQDRSGRHSAFTQSGLHGDLQYVCPQFEFCFNVNPSLHRRTFGAMHRPLLISKNLGSQLGSQEFELLFC